MIHEIKNFLDYKTVIQRIIQYIILRLTDFDYTLNVDCKLHFQDKTVFELKNNDK